MNFIFFSFKSGLYRDKSYPRMIIGEEPYIEPIKLERLSLRESNKQQWVTEKVLFHFFLSRVYMELFFLSGFSNIST